MVERDLDSIVKSARNDSVNATADRNSNHTLDAKLTNTTSNSSKIVRAVLDKDVNSTKGLNATSTAKIANVTVAAHRNASSNISSVESSRNASNNSSRPANSTVTARPDRLVKLIKADESLLNKGNATIRILRRRQADSDSDAASSDDAHDDDVNKEDEDVSAVDE